MKSNMKFMQHCVAAMVIGTASAAPTRPLMPLYDAAQSPPAATVTRKGARNQKTIESKQGAMFLPMEPAHDAFADFAYPVLPTAKRRNRKATRDAAQSCLEKLLPF